MRTFLPLLFVSFLAQGCVQTIAVRTMGGIMDYGFEAFNEESDLRLAESALGSNLKLVEALVKADPGNTKLLLMASQGYSAYALGFAEDDSVERARVFYLRAREYGKQILSQHPAVKAALEGDPETLRQALQSLSKADVPAVFWTAFAWGGYINISRTDIEALGALPKVNIMMEFVLQRDPSYYYGGAHLFLGSIIASTPPALGGKPEKAKEHFEQALALNGGKFLMTYVYYAATYAVQIQDQDLFNSLLKKVDEASVDLLPEARLPNAIAKRKATLLHARAAELF